MHYGFRYSDIQKGAPNFWKLLYSREPRKPDQLSRITVEAFVESLCNDCHHWMLTELRPVPWTPEVAWGRARRQRQPLFKCCFRNHFRSCLHSFLHWGEGAFCVRARTRFLTSQMRFGKMQHFVTQSIFICTPLVPRKQSCGPARLSSCNAWHFPRMALMGSAEEDLHVLPFSCHCATAILE